MISEQAEPAAAGGLRQVLRGWRLKNEGARNKNPQLNPLRFNKQVSPINRDPPKADKFPPHGIGGQARFVPTSKGRRSVRHTNQRIERF